MVDPSAWAANLTSPLSLSDLWALAYPVVKLLLFGMTLLFGAVAMSTLWSLLLEWKWVLLAPLSWLGLAYLGFVYRPPAAPDPCIICHHHRRTQRCYQH